MVAINVRAAFVGVQPAAQEMKDVGRISVTSVNRTEIAWANIAATYRYSRHLEIQHHAPFVRLVRVSPRKGKARWNHEDISVLVSLTFNLIQPVLNMSSLYSSPAWIKVGFFSVNSYSPRS